LGGGRREGAGLATEFPLSRVKGSREIGLRITKVCLISFRCQAITYHYSRGTPSPSNIWHTNVGISAPEPIVIHGINVHDLAVASEGSEVRDNCSIST
jgi:hypothetical protein